MPVRVIVVPALSDNYTYLLVDEATSEAAAVDPVDPGAMLAAAAKENATLRAILTTHSHWDHAGGNVELKSRCPTITNIYGGRGDGVAGCTDELDEGDTVAVGVSRVEVLSTPCHTPGHVCYVVDGNIFTGDTMFVSGCGNFNSGTPRQMADAFAKILALPDETKVWVGHEYTCKNCQFALFAEPENEDMRSRLAWAQPPRITVPTTVGDEKRCNPFARLDAPGLAQFFPAPADRTERMRLVRKGKDDWGRGLRCRPCRP